VTRRKSTNIAKKPTPIVLIDFAPMVVETYREPGYTIRDLGHGSAAQPSAVNRLSLRRYRITAELIDEPIEVLRERLTRLFLTDERNPHHWNFFQQAAEELGMPPFDWSLHGSQRRKDRQ